MFHLPIVIIQVPSQPTGKRAQNVDAIGESPESPGRPSVFFSQVADVRFSSACGHGESAFHVAGDSFRFNANLFQNSVEHDNCEAIAVDSSGKRLGIEETRRRVAASKFVVLCTAKNRPGHGRKLPVPGWTSLLRKETVIFVLHAEQPIRAKRTAACFASNAIIGTTVLRQPVSGG